MLNPADAILAEEVYPTADWPGHLPMPADIPAFDSDVADRTPQALDPAELPEILPDGLADRCTIQLAYAIGVAEPVSVYANTHGTGKVADSHLEQTLIDLVPMTPRNIREHLGLNKPIYAPSAAYGHFGRTAGEAGPGTFSWEATDLADRLAAAV